MLYFWGPLCLFLLISFYTFCQSFPLHSNIEILLCSFWRVLLCFLFMFLALLVIFRHLWVCLLVFFSEGFYHWNMPLWLSRVSSFDLGFSELSSVLKVGARVLNGMVDFFAIVSKGKGNTGLVGWCVFSLTLCLPRWTYCPGYAPQRPHSTLMQMHAAHKALVCSSGRALNLLQRPTTCIQGILSRWSRTGWFVKRLSTNPQSITQSQNSQSHSIQSCQITGKRESFLSSTSIPSLKKVWGIPRDGYLTDTGWSMYCFDNLSLETLIEWGEVKAS